MSRVDCCNAVFAGSPIYITDKLQCVLNAAARLVTGHWHTQVRPRLVTLAARGTALARRPRTYPLQTGSHSASLSAEQCLRVPGRLLYTSLRHSQPTSFTVCHSTSPDHTTLPAQHFRSSGLLCRWSDSLELATVQSP